TYYRIFKEADKTENYAELTLFILEMLKILVAQQEEIVTTLTDDKQQLEEIKANISQQIKDIDGSYDKVAFYAILLYLGESKLFASNKELAILDRDIIQLNSKENKIGRASCRERMWR